jgi:hypothetical protein
MLMGIPYTFIADLRLACEQRTERAELFAEPWRTLERNLLLRLALND